MIRLNTIFARPFLIGFCLVASLTVLQGLHALAAGPAATGEGTVISMLPDDALMVVVVPRLSDLDTKVVKLDAPLKMPVHGLLTLAKESLGIKEGLNEAGTAAFAIVDSGEANSHEFTGVGFFPVSDYGKFLEPFSPADQGNGVSLIHPHGDNKGMLVAHKGDYAIFCDDSANQRKRLDAVLQSSAKATNSLGEMKDWVWQQDIALVVTSKGSKVFLPQARESLNSLATLAEQQPGGENAKNGLLIYQQLLTTIENEATQYGFGAKIDDDATVRLTSRALLNTSGKWTKAVAQVKALPTAPLTGLPTGPFFVAYDLSLGGSMGEAFADFSIALMKTSVHTQADRKIDDLQWKNLTDSMKRNLQATQSMAFAFGVPQVGQNIFAGMSGVMRVTDSKAYLQTYQTELKTLNDIYNSAASPPLTQYEVKPWEVDGTPALEVTTDISEMIKELKRQQGGTAGGEEIYGKMFGAGGKFRVYIAPADQQHIALAWDSLDNLKNVISAAKSATGGMAADSGIKLTSGLLLKDAQWVGFLSPSGMISFLQSVMQTAAPQLPIRLPDFPQSPPIGFSAHAEASRIDSEIVVPTAVLEGVGTYIQQLQLMFGGALH